MLSQGPIFICRKFTLKMEDIGPQQQLTPYCFKGKNYCAVLEPFLFRFLFQNIFLILKKNKKIG